MESNEAEVVAILEALQIVSSQASLVVESDSSNAINWVSSLASFPLRFQFLFNEILVLSSINVEFKHVRWMTNGFFGSLAKQGDGSFPFVTMLLLSCSVSLSVIYIYIFIF